jgi:hypothetical protein
VRYFPLAPAGRRCDPRNTLLAPQLDAAVAGGRVAVVAESEEQFERSAAGFDEGVPALSLPNLVQI